MSVSETTSPYSTVEKISIGEFMLTLKTGHIHGPHTSGRLEPKVMKLLELFVSQPGKLFSRTEIEAHVWPHTIVGEDSTARLISKLRQAFSDLPRNPRYIETLSKRGYRLIADVKAIQCTTPTPNVRSRLKPGLLLGGLAITAIMIGVILTLLSANGIDEKSNDFSSELLAQHYYDALTPESLNVAILHYQQIIIQTPERASGYAGLANSLVQKLLRPASGVTGAEQTGLSAALRDNRLKSDESVTILNQALRHSERAITLEPNNVNALKAHGLTLSALGRIEEAKVHYQKALKLEPNAWHIVLNLAELSLLSDDVEQGMKLFERAVTVIETEFSNDLEIVTRFVPDISSMLGDFYQSLKQTEIAVYWYQKALQIRPEHPTAQDGMSVIVAASAPAGD